jgi:hypothetical protein
MPKRIGNFIIHSADDEMPDCMCCDRVDDDFDCCNKCGEITSPMFFDVAGGVLHCSACASKGIKVEKNLLDALKYIVSCPVKQLFSLYVTENIAEDLYNCCEQYAISVVGRPPKSLEYLKMFM